MPKINLHPPLTDPADADVFPVDDMSTTNKDTKSLSLAGLLAWLQFKTAWITTAMLTDNTVAGKKITAITDNTAFTHQAAISSSSGWSIRLVGGALYITASVVAAAAIDDTQTNLVQINLAAFGIATIPQTYFTAFSDGGNAIVQMFISSSGMLTTVGFEPVGIALGDSITLGVVVPVATWA